MRTLRRIFSRFYVYILWLFLSFLITGLIFTRLEDTDAAHKVTLFADVPAVRDAELAAVLEEDLPAPVRMVQVHPFSYAMFDSSTLLGADLYIVPASHAEAYSGSFRAVTGVPLGPEGGYYRGGELWGIKVWDASLGDGVATNYITYPDEDCWLFFNASTGHLASISGEGDDAALAVAQKLLSLTDTGGA